MEMMIGRKGSREFGKEGRRKESRKGRGRKRGKEATLVYSE